METNKQYLSVEDLSTHLHCTPQYVRKLIRDNKIPAELVGKTWVINPSILSDNETMFKLSKDIPDQIRKSNEVPDIVALSFFSGAMGLDYGIEKAGIHPLVASEIEPNARKTILLNRPDIGLIGDINTVPRISENLQIFQIHKISTWLLEDHHARHSVLQVSEKDSKIKEEMFFLPL